MMDDAKHVITYLMDECRIKGSDIILYGRSMGAAVAA